MKSTIKFLVALTTVLSIGLYAEVQKIKDVPGNKSYKKGNLECTYIENKRTKAITYSCTNGISGFIHDNQTHGNYSQAHKQFSDLECEWCKENNKTDGACSACQ